MWKLIIGTSDIDKHLINVTKIKLWVVNNLEDKRIAVIEFILVFTKLKFSVIFDIKDLNTQISQKMWPKFFDYFKII